MKRQIKPLGKLVGTPKTDHNLNPLRAKGVPNSATWADLARTSSSERKKDFCNLFFWVRTSLPRDLIGISTKVAQKKFNVFLADPGTFLAVSQNPLMGGF